MAGDASKQGIHEGPSQATTRRPLLAALLASPFAVPAFSGATRAQGAWRGLNVPKYPNATDYSVNADEDEYDVRFHSQDDVRAVFDFYRAYLEREGFRVTDSRTRSNALKADMVRGQGGPDNTVELDAKLRRGRYKVEIEFDD